MSEKQARHCLYYDIGSRPLRLTQIAPGVTTKAEILDPQTKMFVIDNNYIHIATTSLEAHEISHADFVDLCLRNGAKPPPN